MRVSGVVQHTIHGREAALPMPDNIALRRIVEAMYFDKYGALNGIPADILRKLLWDDISYS